MPETTYCLFSLSRKDESFTNASFAKVEKWFFEEVKAEKPCNFVGRTPKRVSVGSKFIFSFDAQIFGIATAKSAVEKVPFEEQEKQRITKQYVYKHSITFEGASVKPLKKIAKKEIEKSIQIDCGHAFRYLTKNQYNAILEMAK